MSRPTTPGLMNVRRLALCGLVADRATFAPILEPAFLNGVGPRVAVHGLGAIANHAYSAPYDDLKLKGKP